MVVPAAGACRTSSRFEDCAPPSRAGLRYRLVFIDQRAGAAAVTDGVAPRTHVMALSHGWAYTCARRPATPSTSRRSPGSSTASPAVGRTCTPSRG